MPPTAATFFLSSALVSPFNLVVHLEYRITLDQIAQWHCKIIPKIPIFAWSVIFGWTKHNKGHQRRLKIMTYVVMILYVVLALGREAK